MTKRKRKISAKMGLVVGLVVLVCIAAIVVVTRPKAVTFKLADAVGDAQFGFASSFLDMAEIKLMKEKDNLILTMEVCENIPTQMPKYDDVGDVFYYFLFDLDKDNFEDLTLEIRIDFFGLHVSHGSYVLLGPAITIMIPLAEIKDSESFNLRAYSYTHGPWSTGIHDNVPDVGWVEVSLT
jgi:hypothetical protein